MIGAIFYKLGAFFARRLPQKLSESITELFVVFQYIGRFRARRIIGENLRIVMGAEADDAKIRVLSRRIFSYFGRSIYYFLRLPFMTPVELESRCDLNGIDKALERPGGETAFILVGPHLGPWEIGGARLRSLGVPVSTVALPHPSTQVTRFFNERRELLGVECLPLRDSAQALREALREGKRIALLVDRDYGGRTGDFRWFDKDVALSLAHVALAVRCRVPILTTACVFDGDNFKMIFGEPRHPRSDLGYKDAMMDLQRKCIEDMTAMIRRYPDQWFYFHPFGGYRSDNH